MEYAMNRSQNTDVSSKTPIVVAAADTGTVTLVAAKAGWSVHVQRLMVTILTSAAQTLTFQDAAGVVVERTDSAPGANTQYIWDFGVNGKPLTVAQNFVMVISGAGLAAHIQFEGYLKQTGNEYLRAAGVTGTGQAF